MRNIKLDNELFDIRRIAIHDDFYESECGKWFVDNITLDAYSDDLYRLFASQAQEVIEDFIIRMINDE